MSTVPDVSDSELWTVQTTLKERYDRDVAVQPAETQVRVSRHSTEMSSCPTRYCEADDGCHFLVVKTNAERYRCQSFYRVHQQFGTGIEEYHPAAGPGRRCRQAVR